MADELLDIWDTTPKVSGLNCILIKQASGKVLIQLRPTAAASPAVELPDHCVPVPAASAWRDPGHWNPKLHIRTATVRVPPYLSTYS